MPQPDPVPDPLPSPLPERSSARLPALSIRQRFVRIVRVAAAFSIVIAALAVLLVARGQSDLHIHMLIATALGVGLTVLLATALMSLIFLSHRSGHDVDAAATPAERHDR